jgi:hypothetical protein
MLPLGLHAFLDPRDEQTLEAELPRVRLGGQVFVHFLGNPQLDADGDLFHPGIMRTFERFVNLPGRSTDGPTGHVLRPDPPA